MRYRNLLFVFLLSIFGVIGSFSESNANERKTIALVQQIGNGDFDRGLNHIVSLAKQGNSAATFLYANLFFETGNLEAFQKYLNLAANQGNPTAIKFLATSYLKGSFGKRKIRDQVDEMFLSNPISQNAKLFDSGRVTLYSERRETYWGSGFNLIYKIKEHISLGIDWTYYLPLFSKQGLFVIEEDEFWFWNQSQLFQENNLDQTKWFQNNFSLGLSLYFSL